MRMLRGIIALIRPKHWIKNGLIFVPFIFSGTPVTSDAVVKLTCAFIAFSLIASAVYVVNDIRDVEKDKKHAKKKRRPIASGVVPVPVAVGVMAALIIGAVLIGIAGEFPLWAWALATLYFAINVAYSFGLKNIPIVDIAILSAGFVIRVLFGGMVLDISVSSWLYLTILAGSLYLGLGKRRNELQLNGSKSRAVNKYYSINFLDKNMYVCMALLLVFYSLWATSPVNEGGYLFLTIPIVILLFMTYSLQIEKDTSLGDPVDVLTGNKALMGLLAFYLVTTLVLVYV